MSNHIDAKVGEIAERIVLVGDPFRAKHTAETYLTDVVCVNEKRAAYCYTGYYEGQRVSVMAVGMGNPSMMIYASELFRDYGVKLAVRAGTSGAYGDYMKAYDIILAQACSTTSGINDYIFNGHFSPIGDFGALCKANEIAKEMGINVYTGNVICNDRFYRDANYKAEVWKKYGCLASEQEGTALYTAAAEFGAKAVMMVGAVCGFGFNEDGTAYATELEENDPPRGVDDMMQLALKTAIYTEI